MNQKSNSRKHLKLFIIYYTGVLKRKIFKIRLVKIKSLIPTPLEYDFCLLVLSAEKQSFWPLVLFRLRNILGGLYHLLGITFFFRKLVHQTQWLIIMILNLIFLFPKIILVFYFISFLLRIICVEQNNFIFTLKYFLEYCRRIPNRLF